MKKTIIRKSVKTEIKNEIPFLLNKVLNYMKTKYEDVNFDNAEYIFSAGYNRSRYFRNDKGKNTKYSNPNVCICTRAKLMLYDKRSLKKKNRIVFVGSNIQIESALVHELTHHVQYERNERCGNELDTTKNELEYLKENYPKYYKKIMT